MHDTGEAEAILLRALVGQGYFKAEQAAAAQAVLEELAQFIKSQNRKHVDAYRDTKAPKMLTVDIVGYQSIVRYDDTNGHFEIAKVNQGKTGAFSKIDGLRFDARTLSWDGADDTVVPRPEPGAPVKKRSPLAVLMEAVS
jgi:hypothetical protein